MDQTNRITLSAMLGGVALAGVSMAADRLGLDLTPGFGLLQTLGLLGGMTVTTAAGYFFLARRQVRGEPRSLMSDIGLRMGMTGLLACYVSGLADVLGVGTHRGARWERPFLGPLQSAGLILGLLVVLVGLLLFWLGGRASSGGGPEVQPAPANEPSSSSETADTVSPL